ncbi:MULTISPECIES: DNA polymerase I [unclassified Leptolyngbya]|uniref:DNA polymerase I n=1 Tax=unclassified Leptolyngbya TaxID=2650499 RepID=UPI0016866830|nr:MULTISPECIES: DNA polymerase I [unclassified Leptolyngbya]MBD1910484.1 DNA polymerase I [Leptolyngbya sp. FACHB-8]MBD2153651.1 DNA polymerase I [Leptolyngbya sp. FACHB-16]
MSSQPLLILIDGHSLAFRSYFAHAKGKDGGLRTSTGIPTSVSYGFLKALLDMMKIENPQYVMVAFDPSERTFRHEADETYKEGRPDAPEDFMPDLKNLQELLRSLNLQLCSVPGYEADDVIGTMARKAVAEGFRVKILTGDRDLFQLIDENEQTTILYLSTVFGKSTPPPREFGVEQVREKMGVEPSQIVDYKALCGDSSDNIPGVKGIGNKTAVELLRQFGSLEEVYSRLDEVPKKAVRTKLETGKDDALRSQYLAQIHLNVPVDVNLEQCKLQGFDEETIVPMFEKLEFRSFLGQLRQLRDRFNGLPPADEKVEVTPIKEEEPEDSDLWFFSAEDTDTTSTANIQPQIIDTNEKLEELLALLITYTDPDKPVAWDTETTSLEPRDADLVGIGCCWGPGPSDLAYIPVGHTHGTNLDKDVVLEVLRPILEDKAYPKALQNAKYDRLVLRCQGICLAGVVFDTMLASYVLNPEEKHNLGELSLKYLGLITKSYTDLVPKGKTIADVSIADVADYCGTDVHTTYLLVSKLRTRMEPLPQLRRLLEAVEQPLEPVLAEMEYTGIRINQEYLADFSKQLEEDLAMIEKHAYEVAGEKFKLGSPKQLSELLFEKLKLNHRKSKKRATGYSTDAATLEKLQGDHPVIDYIIEYRSLSKLKSTYVDALPALVRPDTHRVHTDFNQAITTTGRLSSSDPNLQNIPTRTAFSRQIRKAFLPREGWLLVAADYSQIELRILAHLSQEPILIETYQNNEDVHALTARLLFEKDDVTSDERRLAKTINFGVIYGMGAQRFARESGFSTAQAKTFIDRFYERYSKVFEYLQQMQREALAQGYVETILGRRRYFNFNTTDMQVLRGRDPDSIDLNKIRARDQYDAQLLRAAANAPIQGSSADIIKIAMIRLHEILKQHQSNLLLQVHDELVFEVAPEEWETLKPEIQSAMESAVSLSVPLKVEMNAGPNWMEAK